MITRSLTTLVGSLAIALGASGAFAQGGQPAPAKPAQSQAQPAATPPSPAKPGATDPAKAPAPTTAPAPTAQEKPMSSDEFVYVKLATTKGDLYLELNQAKAPGTVKNFLNYVDKGFYSGTIFHRVIDRFMIQGGGFTPDLKEKPGTDKPIKNEWTNGLKNQQGTVAMARTSNPDSATAQFFINVATNPFLDTPRPPDTAAYCVFGRVFAGGDTIEKIKSVKVTSKGIHEAVPVDPIVINAATRVTKEEAAKAADKESKK